MKKYALMLDGVVAELLTTEGDIVAMFNPAIVWVDVSSGPEIVEGWVFDGSNFAPPPRPPAAPSAPTIVELQALIGILAAQLASLANDK
jgi:hypothetical protein